MTAEPRCTERKHTRTQTYTYIQQATTTNVTDEVHSGGGTGSGAELKQPGSLRREADEEIAQTWSEAAEPRKVEDCFPSFFFFFFFFYSPLSLTPLLFLSLVCVCVRACVRGARVHAPVRVRSSLPFCLSAAPLSSGSSQEMNEAVWGWWWGGGGRSAHRELLYLQMTYPESHDPLNVGWAGGWRLRKQKGKTIYSKL